MAQRYLTAGEISDFLFRSPLIGTRVAITKTAILAGAYDINIYDTAAEWGVLVVQFPGIIEPRGIQVEDPAYGLVTIFPAADGTIRFSGWSSPIGDINKPPYVPPPHTETPLDDLLRAAKSVLIFAAIGFGVYLGIQMWSKSRG